jgi:tetratricopeptide (TPR) repeat protein
VDLYRRLAQARPDAFIPSPDLAASLNNIGGDLSNLGRREEALAASQESVDIRRRLTQARPDAFLPNLAMSLNNLGAMLSNLGRREEALAASQEAVDLYRRLAQEQPRRVPARPREEPRRHVARFDGARSANGSGAGSP